MHRREDGVVRIAYVAEWDAYQSSGVLTKLCSQVSSWTEAGHDAKLFLISMGSKGAVPSICRPELMVLSFLQKKARHFPTRQQAYYLNKIGCVPQLFRALRQFQPEAIYYRQGIWYPGLLQCLGLAPYFVELNARDLIEMRNLAPMKAVFHSLTRQAVLRRSAGLICVSSEIAEDFADFEQPREVIGNGFDLQRHQALAASGNEKVSLVFAGTAGAPWHGADKIARLAEALPQFDFHLAGDAYAQLPGSSPKNLTCHGYLNGKQLKELYACCDVGIGSVAMHRNSMEEASPLKTREYLANGLPVIIGYRDTDFPEGAPFLLQVGNTENNLVEHSDAIAEFAMAWRSKRVERRLVERLDTRAKEQKRLAFIQNILAGRHGNSA